METLYRHCRENESEVERINVRRLRSLEPNITGQGGLLVRKTAVVDYRLVALKMAEEYIGLGGEVRLGHQVNGLRELHDTIEVTARPNNREIVLKCRFLISCSGLMADRLTRMHNIRNNFRIIPFRGEYYRLSARHNQIVQHLIYPIPDPDLPFLGVHLTRMIDGFVTVGPNAVLGWKREGYGKLNVNFKDVKDMVTFAGFWRVVKTHLQSGLLETRNSLWKPGYLMDRKHGGLQTHSRASLKTL